MTQEVPQPLSPLTADEHALVAQLSQQQRQAIDESLLAELTNVQLQRTAELRRSRAASTSSRRTVAEPRRSATR